MKEAIYLDYAATTPMDPRVQEKMWSCLELYGNPASQHRFGKQAANAVEEARAQVAELIHAEPNNIIWTSGATESNNLAIQGIAKACQRQGKHIITTQIEHHSVLDTCQDLARQGFEISYLAPNAAGWIDPELLASQIRPDTLLISMMHVNNETGVIQNIAKAAMLAEQHNILFHVDAAQSVGKLPIDVSQLPIDVLSLTAHKIYGPKGIGAIYLRHSTQKKDKNKIYPLMQGGGQEQGLRPGTLATHQCVGMGEACKIAKEQQALDFQKVSVLREKFWQGLKDLPEVGINGAINEAKLQTLSSAFSSDSSALRHWPGIINIRFENCDKEVFLSKLETLGDLAFSFASACAMDRADSSHVLRAMGLKNAWAKRSLRFSFGRFTTVAEIEFAVQCLRRAYFETTESK